LPRTLSNASRKHEAKRTKVLLWEMLGSELRKATAYSEGTLARS
jgi:hypothetical protein